MKICNLEITVASFLRLTLKATLHSFHKMDEKIVLVKLIPKSRIQVPYSYRAQCSHISKTKHKTNEN